MILFLGLAKPLPFAVYADFANFGKPEKPNNYRLFVVPVERIELPTFGLQNVSSGVAENQSCDCAAAITVILSMLKPKVDFLNSVLMRSGRTSRPGLPPA
jgi:hypothetical protein